MNKQELWNDIAKALQEEIGTEEFALWFSSAAAEQKDDKSIVMYFPGSFFADKVRREYKSVLTRIVKKCVGNAVSVDIVSDEKKSNNTPSSPPLSSRKKSLQTKDKQGKTQSRVEKNNIKTYTAQEHNRKQSTNVFNKEMTFDTFVIGESNEFATRIAERTAQNPGTGYNPVLIYGNVGLGKTHILHAIGNEITQRFPELRRVVYVSAESFLNDFVDALKRKKESEFKQKYRNADVLLIDDIQFMAAKNRLQQEFFYTFNHLEQHRKQMVFACDRPIHEIKDLEERIASRFVSGITADLDPPSVELATAIAESYLEREGKSNVLDKEVIEVICTSVRTNVRDLLGMVKRALGYQEIIGGDDKHLRGMGQRATGNQELTTKKSITPNVIREWIKKDFPARPSVGVTADMVMKAVAQHFDISQSDLRSKKKTQRISHARWVVMYLMKECTEFTNTEIGDYLLKSHVAVSQGCSKIEKDIATDVETERTIQSIRSVVYQMGTEK